MWNLLFNQQIPIIWTSLIGKLPLVHVGGIVLYIPSNLWYIFISGDKYLFQEKISFANIEILIIIHSHTYEVLQLS